MTELKTPEPIEELFEKLRVDTVFGSPIQEGDVTIIPVAEVGIGFGFGSGSVPTPEDKGIEPEEVLVSIPPLKMTGLTRLIVIKVKVAAVVAKQHPEVT